MKRKKIIIKDEQQNAKITNTQNYNKINSKKNIKGKKKS